MLRTLLVGALAALLALPLAPLSAQSSPDSTSDVLVGRTRGTWDLPTLREPGAARGLLVDAQGHRFALEAKLVPTTFPGDLRGGRMEGVLHLVERDGSLGRPFAEVHGTYLVDPDRRGRFEAAITTHARVPVRIGRIEGLFADPQRGDQDETGKYLGRWILRR